MRICSEEPFHGSVGMCAHWAMIVESILSPRLFMAALCGPRKRMPFLLKRSGSSGFSEACPQPAHTASHLALSAISTMRVTFA